MSYGGEIDGRFLLCPQTAKTEYGPEQSLYTILIAHYSSLGFGQEMARLKAVEYSQEWGKLTDNGEVRGASRLAGEASSREAATSTVVLGDTVKK